MAIRYNSNYDGTRPFSDTCFQIFISLTSTSSVSVPGDPLKSYQIEFSYNATSNVFVGINAGAFPLPTVAVPVVGTSFVNYRPQKRFARGGDVLRFITPDTGAYVGVSISELS